MTCSKGEHGDILLSAKDIGLSAQKNSIQFLIVGFGTPGVDLSETSTVKKNHTTQKKKLGARTDGGFGSAYVVQQEINKFRPSKDRSFSVNHAGSEKVKGSKKGTRRHPEIEN